MVSETIADTLLLDNQEITVLQRDNHGLLEKITDDQKADELNTITCNKY